MHRTYQALALKSAISSYESEQQALQHAQPSAKLPPPPGVRPRNGQAPLTPPPAQLRRLSGTPEPARGRSALSAHSAWDGYHAFAVTDGVLFSFLVHPAMPYLIIKVPALDSLSNAHDSDAWHHAVDLATERASHEFAEATTDPYPFTSWADPLKEPIWENGEIADICEEGSSYPSGKATRVIKYGSAFAPCWSNNDQTCRPNARPSAQLVLPTNNDTFSWHSPVTQAAKTDDLFDNGPINCHSIAVHVGCGVRWDDDKDGQGIATGAIATTTHLSVGTHHITATVTDSQGGVRVIGPVTINVVARPPNVSINQPNTGTTFGSDQTINLRGLASDPQQGDIGSSATWSVDGTGRQRRVTVPISDPHPGNAYGHAVRHRRRQPQLQRLDQPYNRARDGQADRVNHQSRERLGLRPH